MQLTIEEWDDAPPPFSDGYEDEAKCVLYLRGKLSVDMGTGGPRRGERAAERRGRRLRGARLHQEPGGGRAALRASCSSCTPTRWATSSSRRASGWRGWSSTCSRSGASPERRRSRHCGADSGLASRAGLLAAARRSGWPLAMVAPGACAGRATACAGTTAARAGRPGRERAHRVDHQRHHGGQRQRDQHDRGARLARSRAARAAAAGRTPISREASRGPHRRACAPSPPGCAARPSKEPSRHLRPPSAASAARGRRLSWLSPIPDSLPRLCRPASRSLLALPDAQVRARPGGPSRHPRRGLSSRYGRPRTSHRPGALRFLLLSDARLCWGVLR